MKLINLKTNLFCGLFALIIFSIGISFLSINNANHNFSKIKKTNYQENIDKPNLLPNVLLQNSIFNFGDNHDKLLIANTNNKETISIYSPPVFKDKYNIQTNVNNIDISDYKINNTNYPKDFSDKKNINYLLWNYKRENNKYSYIKGIYSVNLLPNNKVLVQVGFQLNSVSQLPETSKDNYINYGIGLMIGDYDSKKMFFSNWQLKTVIGVNLWNTNSLPYSNSLDNLLASSNFQYQIYPVVNKNIVSVYGVALNDGKDTIGNFNSTNYNGTGFFINDINNSQWITPSLTFQNIPNFLKTVPPFCFSKSNDIFFDNKSNTYYYKYNDVDEHFINYFNLPNIKNLKIGNGHLLINNETIFFSNANGEISPMWKAPENEDFISASAYANDTLYLVTKNLSKSTISVYKANTNKKISRVATYKSQLNVISNGVLLVNKYDSNEYYSWITDDNKIVLLNVPKIKHRNYAWMIILIIIGGVILFLFLAYSLNNRLKKGRRRKSVTTNPELYELAMQQLSLPNNNIKNKN